MVALRTYLSSETGDLIPLDPDDPPSLEVLDRNDHGDSLLTFVVRECQEVAARDDTPAHFEVAAAAIARARDELDHVVRGLERAADLARLLHGPATRFPAGINALVVSGAVSDALDLLERAPATHAGAVQPELLLPLLDHVDPNVRARAAALAARVGRRAASRPPACTGTGTPAARGSHRGRQ